MDVLEGPHGVKRGKVIGGALPAQEELLGRLEP